VTPNIEQGGSGSTRGSNTPISARIENDPSQAAAWQMQSSVRHVQAPGGPAYAAVPTNYQGGSDFGPPDQFRARSASAGSQRQAVGRPPQSDAEQLPYRPSPGAGPMGVAG
jgi:hypothetical protein